MQHLECLGMSLFTGPINTGVLHTILGKELAGTSCRENIISLLLQHTGRLEHIHFLLRCSGRKQNLLLRDAITHGKHSLEHGTGSIAANATHFTGRSHIHSQYRVGFLEAVERELARLDPDIIEFEQILLRLLNRQAEHDFRGKFDKIDLQYLADEGERTAGTKITLDHLYIIVFSQILNVERAGDIERLGYLTTDAFNATNRLYIQLLRRKLDSGVTGMYSRKLNVFGDCISDDFTVLCHSIHLHLLGMFDELADHYRMLLRYVGRQLQKAFQLFLVGAYVHCRTAEHIRRTDKHRETYLIDKRVNVLE